MHCNEYNELYIINANSLWLLQYDKCIVTLKMRQMQWIYSIQSHKWELMNAMLCIHSDESNVMNTMLRKQYDKYNAMHAIL